MFQEFKETFNYLPLICKYCKLHKQQIFKCNNSLKKLEEWFSTFLSFNSFETQKNRETQINDLFWRFTPKVTRFPTIWSNIFLMPRKPRYWRSASILCNTYKAVKPDSQFFFPASMNCTKWLKHSISDPKMSWLHVD